jgi:hypothetical protein
VRSVKSHSEVTHRVFQRFAPPGQTRSFHRQDHFL